MSASQDTQGEAWWLETYELECAQADEMEKRQEDDSWEQRLLPYLHDNDCKEDGVTTGEVLAKLGVIPTSRASRTRCASPAC
jgi:hypothetical protein